MQLTIPNPQTPKWVFLIFFIFFFNTTFSNPQTFEAGVFCGSLKQEASPNFIPNFITAMDEVSRRFNEYNWGANAVVLSNPEVFTYAQCYGFLSHKDCLACFSEIRTKLPKCLPSNSGRIYLDGCFLRYDNYNFFAEALNEKHDTVKCGSLTEVNKDKSIGKEFGKIVYKALENVTEIAVANKGFALTVERGGLEAIYAMAQCWMTVDTKSCKKCLLDAWLKLRKCSPATDGRVMNAGCYLRYSTEKFFDDGLLREDKSGKNVTLTKQFFFFLKLDCVLDGCSLRLFNRFIRAFFLLRRGGSGLRNLFLSLAVLPQLFEFECWV
jgi:hypothetical protein